MCTESLKPPPRPFIRASPPHLPPDPRFVCEISILYSAEGGFELPQRTFDALVKIAHYYNYNASGTPPWSAPDPCKNSWRRGGGGARGTAVGGGLGGQRPSFKASLERGTTPFLKEGTESFARENDGSDDDMRVVPSDRGRVRTADSWSSVATVDDQEKSSTPSDSAAAGTTGGLQEGGSEGGGGGSGGDVSAGGGTTNQQPTKPKKEPQKQPIGDDWYTEGGLRPNNLAQQNGSSSRNKPGGGCWGESAWSKTAREITRVWVRAVGSLCCPSHSELWPQLLDVGIIGALNT